MNADDVRFVLLAAHALAAVVALAAGILVVAAGRGLRTHVVSTWVMAALLVPTLVLGYPAFTATTRLVFAGLAALAAVMAVRGTLVARAERAGVVGRRSPRVVEVVGFNVISLVVAGTIVPVLRLGAGPLVIALDVVVCVLLGRWFVQAHLRRLRPSPAGAAT